MKSAVRISPKDYKDPSNVDKVWRVYINVKRPSQKKYHYKEFKAVMQNGVKINLNNISNHKEKVKIAELIKQTVIYKIQNSPLMVVLLLYGLEESKKRYKHLFMVKQKEDKDFISIEKAFEDAYTFKSGKDYSVSFIRDIRSIKNRFLNWLGDKKEQNISSLTFDDCNDFLNEISEGKANKTYNNNKKYISNYLAYLKSKRLITENFMDGVGDLRTNPKKNKPFSKSQLNKLWELLEDNEPLKFYCQHIYYLIRMTTIIRIKCKDIVVDGDNMHIMSESKNGFIDRTLSKTLVKKYSQLDLTEGDKFIFGRNGLVENWNANESSRRQYYSEMFKPYKEQLGINNENLKYYGLNSIRHNGHIDAFYAVFNKEKDKGSPDAYRKALKMLMHSTGKETVKGVDAYLRGISNEYRIDFSEYID